MPRTDRTISPHKLVETAIDAVERARSDILQVLRDLGEHPDDAKPFMIRSEREGKMMLQIDSNAEEMCRHLFKSKFNDGIQFIGEESLSSFAGWGTQRYCVLVDMVDGTDLVEMNLGLWCSAVLVYDLEERSIVTSVVGLPNGETYYADRGRPGAWVQVDGREYQVDGCSRVTEIRKARIAYYGQKPANFLSLSDNEGFRDAVRNLGTPDDGLRIYNFAGNPMMVKLCNRPKTASGKTFTGDIDAVFDLLGQQLHDVVPGAFIAMQGGAHLFDLAGNSIDYAKLGELLHNPKASLAYVLAATPELGAALCGLLGAGPVLVESLATSS